MKTQSKTLGRERFKQARVHATLRERIVAGKYAPDAALPTRAQLMAEFGVSVVTVQKAVDRLEQDGFVRSKWGSGTFVAENPPHLSHYGLVFGYRPEEPSSWSGLARAMRDAAFAIDRSESRRLSFYFHTGYALHKTDHFDRLVREVESDTLAGLIFVESPHRLVDTPVVQRPGIPRVAIMSDAVIPGVAAVYADLHGFFDRALDELRARGRRRVAILSREYSKPLHEYVRAAIAQRGMEMLPYWWQAANVDNGDWARNSAHLLLHNPADRPDAIIIADEMFVTAASAGIAAAGVSVERDLDVIAHCNYPTLPAKVLPIRLLGFDCERLLRTCIEQVDRERQGKSMAEMTLIPAQFEEELASTEMNARASRQHAEAVRA